MWRSWQKLAGFVAVFTMLSGALAQPANALPAPRTSTGVVQFSPQGELASARQVTARFATDMVSLGGVALKNPFLIKCAAKGTGRWIDARHWAYDFAQDVPSGYSCSFTRPAQQRDLAGALVGGPKTFAFNTSPLAEAPLNKAPAGVIGIDFFVPQGEAYPVRQVQVRFAEDMVRLGADLRNPFGVGCAVKGVGRWVDGRNWVYDFVQDLPSGIACQFVPVKNLRGVSGKLLKAYPPLAFTTGGPHMVDIRPEASYERIDERQVFLLKFDGENDRLSLAKSAYCVVAGLNEKIPLRFLPAEETQTLLASLPKEYQEWWNYVPRNQWLGAPIIKERRAVSCARQLLPDAKVQLVLGKGLASATGVMSSADQVFNYQVRPSFTANFSCTRESARHACAPMTPMRVEFSDTVSADLLKGVRLSSGSKIYTPQQNISDEYGEGSGEPESALDNFVAGNALIFQGPFAPDSSFSLTLPANFRDESGRPLLNASRFPLLVKTANYPPLAKFAADFGIVEASAGAVPLTLRNLEPGKGAGPEARLLTLALPDSDVEFLRWMRRFQQHQSQQSCFQCVNRDAQGNLLKPDPRSLSLLAGVRGVSVQTLPRALAAKEFEVIGIPAKTGAVIHEVESRYLGASLIANHAPMYVSALSVVTNIGVHLRSGSQNSLVWVTALDTGLPLANAEVAVFDCNKETQLWQGKTDAHGLAYFATPTHVEYGSHCMGRYAVFAHFKGDRGVVFSDWNEGIQSWRFNFSGWQHSGSLLAHSVLDRTLLRAGETLHLRHVVRELALQALIAPRNARYKRLLIRHDGSGQEYELPLTIGKDGNGDNEWKIPRAAKLGRYSITLEAAGAGSDNSYFLGDFRVEEFRLPVLKAQLQLPAGPQLMGRSLPVDMSVQYINGGAFPNASVTLRGMVRSSGTVFAGFDDYAFGDWRSNDQEQALAEQSLTLDDKGGLRAASAALPAITKISQLRMEMEYRDPSGETHTSTASTSVWPASVIAGVKLPNWISSSRNNEPQAIHIVSLGLDGKPRARVPVSISAEINIQQSHRRRTVGGFYAYESVQKKEPVPVHCTGDATTHAATQAAIQPTTSTTSATSATSATQATTGTDGRLQCSFMATTSGELTVQITAQDEQGRRVSSASSTWLSNGDRSWFDQSNDDRIDLLPEKKEYNAGDLLKLQVRMPFPDATALVSVERDGILSSFVQPLSAKNPVISLPIKAEYAPNVFVSVFLVRGRNQAVAPTALIDLGKPAFKLGIAEIKVGWSALRLGVQLSTDKPRYHPREQAKLRVQVTPPAGQNLPADTEITVSAVDEALLELASNDTVDVLTPMMAERGHEVETATSQLQIVGKRHYGRKALPAGGGGGRGGSTRELFDTLIYWQARAKVDANGRAELTVPLNDSLSGFKLVATAISENRFGHGSTRMESFQDISVLSGLPLVVRQGDKLDPGFTLRNSSDHDQTLQFTAALEGQGNLLSKTVTVAAGKSVLVSVPFTVPADTDTLTWRLTAKGEGGVGDSLKVSQRVLDPVPERVLQATLLQLDAPTRIPVQKPQGALPGGALQVSAQASLTQSLGEMRRYFENYPYSCLEQKTSKAAGLQDRARWDEVMELLPAYLDSNGFAAFYPGSTGYPFLTAYILRMSQALGWPVPDSSRQIMLNALVNYVEGRVSFDDWRLHELDDAHRRLEVLSLLAQAGRFNPSQLGTLQIDPPQWTTSMLVSWLELLRAAPSLPRQSERMAQANSLLRSRLTLQGTAYLLSEGEYSRWWLYDNDQSTVARLMLATMDLPAWREDQPRLLRGLLMRQREGRWHTTLANIWSGLALKRFADTFERSPVQGRTTVSVGNDHQALEWRDQPPAPLRMAWPEQPTDLQLAQEGSGKPWVTVQVRARVPLKASLSTGFGVSKTLVPLQQKIKGQWSVGDVVRVDLALSAQSDIGWVAVDDPIPAGSTLLGRALGRDGSMAEERGSSWTWATFVEFGADSYRAYYERIYKGDWRVSYTVRLNQSGDFRLPPTRVEAMYAPEMFGMLPNQNWVVRP